MLVTLGSGLLTLALLAPSSRAAGVAKVALPDHVPAVVAQLLPNGSLAADTNLALAFCLPLRNREALTNLLAETYDPASTNYHRFLTPAEFAAQFGPTEQDYQSVADYAKANGLQVIGTHANRVLLDVSGRVSDIEKTFGVKMRTYRHPHENRNFFAPDTAPVVAASLPILSVSGLDNYSLARPAIKALPAGLPAGHSPNNGSAPGGAYQGNDFRTAYVPGTSLTGAGQNVALLQFDGFYPGDISAYAAQIGLTNPPAVVVVPVNGGVPTPGFGNSEVCLDIEMILSMSPGVSNILVYEAPNPSPWLDILNKIATDNAARQISCSWYQPFGGPNPAAEQIFQQMALQGQTFFTASGDSDAYTGLIPFPCDSPHITAVGGTTLTTGPKAAYTSETVWNWGNEFGPSYDGIGSSGGVSTSYTIPTWQTNLNMVARGGSGTMRNVPDVALTGDNVWVIFNNGASGAFGGTSCAAPLWAGFMALVNQQGTINGRPPIGFLNPAVYTLAASAIYTNCFHDTTTGDNTWSGSPSRFYATNNYDLATGLGVPNGTNLINALTAAGVTNPIIHLSPPAPPYGSTLSGLNGGNPNGTWQLFVLDNAVYNTGIISNGWILALTTASPVGYSADLALAMTVSTDTTIVSNYLAYTITVTNYGPSISSNVLVSDTLPLYISDVSFVPSQGTVMRSGQGVSWNVGSALAPNTGAQLVINLRPGFAGNLINYASVSAATPDGNPADDFASAQVNVIGTPSPPVLTAGGSPTGSGFQLSVAGDPVSTIVQASTNLTYWVNLYTNTPPFVYTNLDSSSYRMRFYRVVTGP